MEFDYRIIFQNDVLIVTFKGMISKETKDRMQNCLQEIIALEPKLSVLVFKDVPAVDMPIFRELTMIQQEIRKKGGKLFITGLSVSLKNYLIEKAIVRNGELKNSLEEALSSR